MIADGQENIPDGAVIFAGTHQGILDGFVWIPYIHICRSIVLFCMELLLEQF